MRILIIFVFMMACRSNPGDLWQEAFDQPGSIVLMRWHPLPAEEEQLVKHYVFGQAVWERWPLGHLQGPYDAWFKRLVQAVGDNPDFRIQDQAPTDRPWGLLFGDEDPLILGFGHEDGIAFFSNGEQFWLFDEQNSHQIKSLMKEFNKNS